MKRSVIPPQRYLLAQLVALALFGGYLVLNFLTPHLAPKISLHLTLSSTACPTVIYTYTTPRPLFGSTTTTGTLALSDALTDHALVLSPTTPTVYLQPCTAGDLTVAAVALRSSRGQVDYALETGDLQCYGCQLIKNSDSTITIKTTTADPQFVIGNLHHKALYLLPTIYRPGRYLPLLVVVVILSLLLIPALISVTDFVILAQASLLGAYTVYRWAGLHRLFPLPTIGSTQIVAYAQFIALPIRADTVIFALLVLAIPLLALVHRLLQKRHVPSSTIYLLTTFFCLYLIYVLENA